MGDTVQPAHLPTLWIERFGSCAEVEGILLLALSQAGVRVVTRSGSPGASEAAGAIVLFDDPSPAVRECVRESAATLGCRVLAVATKPLSRDFAWDLLAAGVADVLAWDHTAAPTSVVLGRVKRWAEVDQLVESPLVRENLVGRSVGWIDAIRRVVEAAAFSHSSILIVGETGTGKELLAKLVHHLDRRSPKGPFALLDCTTVVPELAGSEFFGHERGAFTNAVASREGVFATANGGTLFLDEVGELPLPMQASLLRIVQERTYKPVGANHWKRSDFRLVCATNRDLLAEESRGAFRRDFYFRIAASHMRIPPLSERREDIPLLVDHFLRSLCPGGEVPRLDPFVRDYLQVRDYPGNVRELRHLVARLVERYVGQGPITVGHLPDEERPKLCDMMAGDWRRHLKTAVRHAMLRGFTLREISGGASEAAIETAINEEGGNLQRAAKRLGVTDRALQLRRAAGRDVAS